MKPLPARLTFLAFSALVFLGLTTVGCQNSGGSAEHKNHKGKQKPANLIQKNGKQTTGFGEVTLRIQTTAGIPLSGARIQVGTFRGISDAGGFLRLSRLTPGRMTARIEHPGYAETFKVLRASENTKTLARVYMVKERLRLLKNMSRSQKITMSDIEIEIPGGTFVNDKGQTVESARLKFAPLHVRGREVFAMPGEFLGRDSSGKTTPLESFGAASISLYSLKDGGELKIKPGKYLILRMPYQNKSKKKAGAPMWSLNENTGIWEKEFDGRLFKKGDKTWFEARLPHLSWWNCDAPLENRTAVWVQSFVNETGENLFTPTLEGVGVDYNGVSSSYLNPAKTVLPGRCIDVKISSKTKLISDFYDGEQMYEFTKDLAIPARSSTCRLNPDKGLVIEQVTLKKIESVCVRGKINLKGASPDTLRTEVYLGAITRNRPAFNANSRNGLRGPYYRGRVERDGSFCMDHIPASRATWLYFINQAEPSIDDCDREKYAPFKVKVPNRKVLASCTKNSEACVDVGALKGRLALSRCRE